MNITRNLALIAVMGASTVAPLTLAEESSRSMEEVVVTSRRKDESVQDVPLSVTAFGEEAIEQIKPNTLRDFDGLVPNVYIGMNTAGPGASALYIRGVGYADIEKTQSPQVGVIVDGIQMGSSTGQLIDVFDVESIEINRGPQGVLFGKNTIGGNIVVNRVKPQFNDFGVKASAEMGNYNG
ncbi:MAG: Plug domain-containing protein, partial [Pseudomonadales bacterium]|nr:Plug domain-containing protein [Pseudomonadales bacterium]